MENKKALITGITGQDGSYMAELLLSKGYEVYGMLRRTSSFHTWRLEHLHSLYPKNLHMHYGDITDAPALFDLCNRAQPDEIYNLAAMSQVRISFEIPKYTIETNTIGTLNILEWIRQYSPKTKFYQASSSEMFGMPEVDPPFNEDTPMRPQSPYGISKLAAFHLVRIYAKGYGLFATTGILFNHESSRRGENFVSKKITQGVARIKAGLQNKLYLGNLEAKRDWGWAPEFVDAIYSIMQYKEPEIFVVATKETHTIREFVEEAFSYAGLDWKKYVAINEKYKRPQEVPVLLGDPSKISSMIGWKAKMKFKDIVKAMVDYDMKNVPTQNVNFDHYHR